MLETIVKKINAYHIAIFFAVMFTTLLLTINLAPVLTKYGDSNAETPAKLNINIESSMSISSTTDSISLNLSPNASGAFSYGSTDINITSNNLTGYYLTLSTDTDDTALNLAESSDSKIASLTSDVTVSSTDQSAFTMNSWGYTTENNLASTSGTGNTDTTFHKVSGISSPNTIHSSNVPGSTKTTVTFATRVNPNLMSGTYTNTVVFTAISNDAPEDEEKNFFSITTMQDMTASICDTAITPSKTATESIYHYSEDTSKVPTTVLTDVRDGETYIVRKLADGNCWMSQNLRLKLTANTPLTSADTDVTSNFTPTISTQATSENTTSWGAYNNASDVNKSRSYDTGNRDYGTYYNWYTATAGTGLYDNTTTNATSSICPKGWQLPQNTGTKSYYNLITTTYGLASNTEGSTALQSAPLGFPLSGFYNYSGSVDYQGSYGVFWSATPRSSAGSAYLLNFGSSYIYPQDYDYKADGLSVRCVARNSAYTITFNAGDGQGSVDPINTYVGEKIDLSTISSKFSKPGFKLTGWKDQYDNTYATDATVDINPEGKGSIVLTAQWQEMPTFFTISTMQEMTSDICASATTPNVTGATNTLYDTDGTHHGDKAYVPQRTLSDIRDNETYIVRKLADGNCWMSQNLRIVGSKTLTSADSDVSSNYTLPAAQTSAFTNSSNNNQVGAVQSSYGNGAYYSWYAATAGTGTASMSSGKATSSICPKGWQLPEGGASTTKSFNNLITTTYGIASSVAGSTALQAQPLQFVLAGYYYTLGFVYGGSDGRYWSSSVYYASYAYDLRFDSSYVSHQYYDYKYLGVSVRCVAH